MGKLRTVNQNTLVTEIMTVGGVNKVNATGIFNIFTNAWNTDRINFLKAVDAGIVVKRTRTAPVKRKVATTKTATVKTAKVKKTKTTTTKKVKATGAVVGKVKTKKRKKLKAKKGRVVVPATGKTKTTHATA